MPLRVLTTSDVDRCLPMREAIAGMEEAFAALARGEAEVPLRARLATPGGPTLAMPAHVPATGGLGVKLVAVRPGNAAQGLPTHTGLVLLLDAATGTPAALLDAARLTALRTAAASAVATRLLARPDAAVLAILGAGAQARAHLEAMAAVRPLREVRVASASGATARAWAAELAAAGAPFPVRAFATPAEAARGADVVCCCTSSPTPVLRGADVAAGAHVNAVGAFAPTTREVDEALVRRAAVVAVDRRATLLEEAGDLALPVRAGALRLEDVAELGELLLGARPGRRGPGEVTLFKSVGNAAQDVVAAQRALARAEALGLGRVLDLEA